MWGYRWLDLVHLQHLIPEVVDDFHRDPARLRLIERARCVAVERRPGFFVDLRLERRLERAVGIVRAQEVGAGEANREAGRQRQLAARRQHDTYDRLPSLLMPVYICGGKYDGIAPVENLKALERQIPNARSELFEGGHLFLMQDGRAFERVIMFLRGELNGEQAGGSART